MASTPWPPESSNVSIATAGANSSTWATNKDWTKHRALIGELYDNQPLAEVMKIMESKYKFKATSVYQTNLLRYGLTNF